MNWWMEVVLLPTRYISPPLRYIRQLIVKIASQNGIRRESLDLVEEIHDTEKKAGVAASFWSGRRWAFFWLFLQLATLGGRRSSVSSFFLYRRPLSSHLVFFLFYRAWTDHAATLFNYIAQGTHYVHMYILPLWQRPSSSVSFSIIHTPLPPLLLHFRLGVLTFLDRFFGIIVLQFHSWIWRFRFFFGRLYFWAWLDYSRDGIGYFFYSSL